MAYKYKAEIKSVDERSNLPIKKELIMDGPYGTEEIVDDMLLNGGCEKVDVKVSLYDEKFDEWYWKSLDVYQITGENYLSYEAFCKGAPDRWTPENLNKIKQLKGANIKWQKYSMIKT